MEWQAYIDGASSGNPGESGAGVVVFDSAGAEILRKSIYLGKMTNNMAEYEALLHAVSWAQAASVETLRVYTDSELIARQVSGVYAVKNVQLKKYFQAVKDTVASFLKFEIRHIPRERNGIADKLARDGAHKRGRWVVAGIRPEESPGIAGQDGP